MYWNQDKLLNEKNGSKNLYRLSLVLQSPKKAISGLSVCHNRFFKGIVQRDLTGGLKQTQTICIDELYCRQVCF